MSYKIKIVWSEAFENSIIDLARYESDFLKQQQCIYTYVISENYKKNKPFFKNPVYMACFLENSFHDTIKDKLLQNLGRSDSKKIFEDSSIKTLKVIVSGVITDGFMPISGYRLKSLYYQLIKEFNPLQYEIIGYNEMPTNFEVAHSFHGQKKKLARDPNYFN